MIPQTKPARETFAPWTIAAVVAVSGALLAGGLVWLYHGLALVDLMAPLLVAFIVLLFWPMVSDLRRGCFDPLASRNVFAFLFFLYGGSLPLLTYLRGESVSQVASTEAIVTAFAVTVLSTVFFLLGYRSKVAARVSGSLPLVGPVSVRDLRVVTLAVVMAAVLWFGLFVYSVGGLGSFLRAGYADIYEIEEGREYLGFSLTLMPVCVLLIFHLANRARSSVLWLVTALAVASSTALLLSGSRRRLLITIILSVLIYCHYAIRRIPTKLLLGSALIGGLAVSSLGLLRSIPPEELATRGTVEFIAEQSPSQLFYTFLEIGEPATDFETFPFIVNEISKGMSFRWGRTYFEAPLILIPRLLYPNRSLTASQWYVGKFFPEVAAQLGGRPLFFLGEAYLNFGVLGPLALMFLVGVGCRVAYSFLQRSNFSPESALIYAAVLAAIPSAIRIDFATALKVSFASTLPLVLFVVWYSRARRTSFLGKRRWGHSAGLKAGS